MTAKVVLVNASNWDEDVRVTWGEREVVLKRGEQTAVPATPGAGPTRVDLAALEPNADGYLGEPVVHCHLPDPDEET